jgi:hypothetical protein
MINVDIPTRHSRLLGNLARRHVATLSVNLRNKTKITQLVQPAASKKSAGRGRITRCIYIAEGFVTTEETSRNSRDFEKRKRDVTKKSILSEPFRESRPCISDRFDLFLAP